MGELNQKLNQYFAGRVVSPFIIDSLTPIQMPHLELDEILEGRKNFTKDEWIDVLRWNC